MRIVLTAATVCLVSFPAMACEGFNNSMAALEHAMGITQTPATKGKLVKTEKPPRSLPKSITKKKAQQVKRPVTTRNTL